MSLILIKLEEWRAAEGQRRRRRATVRERAAEAAVVGQEREREERLASARQRARATRAAMTDAEVQAFKERNRQTQARRRAQLSTQEAEVVRARNRQEQARRKARLPAGAAARIQEKNTTRHRNVYWDEWPAEYRSYVNDIAAARRLFYAQARQAEGSLLPESLFSCRLQKFRHQ
jgi:hypothetical protein